MKAKLVGSMPSGDWIYEIKFDGYRALALRGGSETRILSATRVQSLARRTPSGSCRSFLADSGRKTSGIGQRTLQLGSPSGGVNFFNAICRLLMYEGSFSTRFSDLLISTDSFVCAESVSAGVGLRSGFSVSIDPLQLINVMVLSTAIILNSSQVGCTRSEKCLEVSNVPTSLAAPRY